ncbi:MAG: hypothetical protein GY797_34045 [Deltaproteobacteria bacterium]|nr:hypothetical protein [Deltaproteobacteria bacterium]
MVELVKYLDNVVVIACGFLGLLFAYRKWPEKPEKKKNGMLGMSHTVKL